MRITEFALEGLAEFDLHLIYPKRKAVMLNQEKEKKESAIEHRSEAVVLSRKQVH